MVKKCIAKHFMLEGAARSTIFAILQRKARKIKAERKSVFGGKALKMNNANINCLKSQVNHKDWISQRFLAKKFGVSHSYIDKIINTKTSIEFRKKTRNLKRTEAQKAAVRPKCGRLARIFSKKEVVIDDKSYFKLSNCEFSINAGFYTSDIDKTPVDVKCKRKDKFEPKLLVWTAFSAKGMAQPYLIPSGQAVNQDVYLNMCLKKRLVPFIRRVHKNDQVIFWPDLASAHYSKKVQQYLKSQNIECVAKCDNPANRTEVRPVEVFWAKIKSKVYAHNWQAKNLAQLSRRIKWAFNKVDAEFVHRLGKACFTRVDQVRRRGFKNL